MTIKITAEESVTGSPVLRHSVKIRAVKRRKLRNQRLRRQQR